jgi:hypothetical protein
MLSTRVVRVPTMPGGRRRGGTRVALLEGLDGVLHGAGVIGSGGRVHDRDVAVDDQPGRLGAAPRTMSETSSRRRRPPSRTGRRSACPSRPWRCCCWTRAALLARLRRDRLGGEPEPRSALDARFGGRGVTVDDAALFWLEPRAASATGAVAASVTVMLFNMETAPLRLG